MVTSDSAAPRYLRLPAPDPLDDYVPPTREEMLARHAAAGGCPPLDDVAAVIARLDQGHADQDPNLFMLYHPWRGDGPPQRLMDTDDDQESTTDNPYWDVVRHLPHAQDHMGAPGGAVDAELMDPYYPQRLDLQRWFSWAIPTPYDLTWLVRVLAGRPLLDMGAGSGYWAWQLAQSGVDVLAVDHVLPVDNRHSTRREPWHPIHLGTGDVAGEHPDRVLMLCWPPLEEPLDAEALSAYRGDTLVTVGQMGGICGSDEGYALLQRDWVPYLTSSRHTRFRNFTCNLRVWARHCRLDDAPGKGEGE